MFGAIGLTIEGSPKQFCPEWSGLYIKDKTGTVNPRKSNQNFEMADILAILKKNTHKFMLY